jgi:hypothetical protein
MRHVESFRSAATAIAASLAIAAAVAAQDAEVEPRFATGSLAELRARAKAAQKPLVVEFGNDAIEPCRRTLRTTWRDAALWRWLDANALAARVDPEQDATAKEFALVAYPTFVVLGKDGTEAARIVGCTSAAALLGEVAAKSQGAPTDHRGRTKLAEQSQKAGDLDGALAHFLWLWDDGEKHNPGFGGVRQTSFVNKLAALVKQHPPARRAIDERCAALEQALRTKVDYQPVTDLIALAKALDTPLRPLAVLDELPATAWSGEQHARRVLVRSLVAPLVDAKRHADVVRIVGDPQAFLAHEFDVLTGPGAPPLPERMRKEMHAHTMKRQRPLLEAYFGARDAGARALADKLLERDAAVDTWLLILNAAKAGGDDVACHDFAVRALQELPDGEHDRVRTFLKRQ